MINDASGDKVIVCRQCGHEFVFTKAEQEFWLGLGARLPAYRDVLTTYAIELKASNGVTDPRFHVSPAMRNELGRRLAQREITVTADAWGLVEQHFVYEAQRYVFGRESENLRRLEDDLQVRAGLDLLRQAGNQTELLALARQESGLGRSN